MAKKKKGADDDKVFAFLGVFLTVIGFLVVMLAKKDSKYAMFYGKQGLVLFIAWIVAWVASLILGAIFAFLPVFGWVLSLLVSLAVSAGMFILWIIGLIYSLSGEMKPIPIIGQFAEKINI